MPHHRPPQFELHLSFEDAPAIWRRLRMSSGATLARAQRVFCVAWGWPGGRPYAFEAGPVRYACLGGRGALVDVRLRQLLPDAGTSLEFEYAEPAWHMLVRVERLLPATPAPVPPRCLAGEGSAPHVDSAGFHDWGEDRGAEVEPPFTALARGTLINLDAINAELVLLP